jgi:hypothetical protein
MIKHVLYTVTRIKLLILKGTIQPFTESPYKSLEMLETLFHSKISLLWVAIQTLQPIFELVFTLK